MIKRKNTGFSMVEIIISVAIFALLMFPIVSSILSSLKSSTGSKELQYRNDFAENMMEHIKAVPIDEVNKADYYEKNGTLAGTFTAGAVNTTEYGKDADGNAIIGKSYTMTGKTKLGTQKTTYNYKIKIDNNAYADKKNQDNSFLDPNNLALGVVEDIDYTKVALIDGTILNYDTTASTAFLTRKLQALRETNEWLYEQFMSQASGGADRFLDDMATRLMTIEISGNKTSGYTVRCILDYLESNPDIKSDNHIGYVPYAASFEKELPNIYLMYNPCYYNNKYSPDDYIAVDTTGLDDSDVNIFLVEIAENYSQQIMDSGKLTSEQMNKTSLYNNIVSNGQTRDTTNIHMVAVKSITSDDSFLKKIHVYHNIGDNVDASNAQKRNKKSDINKFWYSDKNDGNVQPGITDIKEFIDVLNDGAGTGGKKEFINLVSSGSSNNASVKSLNAATEEERGLYQVQIWLKEESKGDIDTSVDKPILEGTKGGNETK